MNYVKVEHETNLGRILVLSYIGIEYPSRKVLVDLAYKYCGYENSIT